MELYRSGFNPEDRYGSRAGPPRGPTTSKCSSSSLVAPHPSTPAHHPIVDICPVQGLPQEREEEEEEEEEEEVDTELTTLASKWFPAAIVRG